MLFLRKNHSINHFFRVSRILSLDYFLAMTKYCYLKQKFQSNFITPVEDETFKLIDNENDFKIEDPRITAK
jgi:hypothetical protein